jgi:ABC-type transport system involved in multi-copper enzyme maturation permease subunit
MSTVVTTPTRVEQTLKLHHAKPRFFGTVRGEFFKIGRQWTNWIMLVLLLGVIVLPYIIEMTAPNVKTNIQTNPLHFFYDALSIGLSISRVFTGIFLLILTARTFGLEYQLGTIRVLLSRGVGRLHLLFAKLLTVVMIALGLLVSCLLLNYLLTVILVVVTTGNLNAFNALTPAFWSDARIYVLTILINMGVTILLATAAAVVGRSVTFGLSAAIIFFPIDNIATIVMTLAFRITHNDFWLSSTAFFLGPNLNVMAPALTSNRVESIGATPLYFVDPAGQAHGILVDGTHTIVVALVYAAIFAVTAIVLTWKRDVKE